MGTQKHSIGLILIVVVLGIWVILLTLQMTFVRAEVRLMQNMKLGAKITPHILSQANIISQKNHREVINQHDLKVPGQDGRIIVVRLFGGTYLYISLNSNQEVVDYRWYRT